MEWYYYAIGILAATGGLVIVYIIFRRLNVIDPIPILSNVIDPILNSPLTLMETYKGKIMYYETKRPKTGYWNSTTTEKQMLAFWEQGTVALPEEMHNNNSKAWLEFEKTLDTTEIDAPAEMYRHYDQKTGILEEYYEIVYFAGDEDEPTEDNAITKYNFKTGEVIHEINI